MIQKGPSPREKRRGAGLSPRARDRSILLCSQTFFRKDFLPGRFSLLA